MTDICNSPNKSTEIILCMDVIYIICSYVDNNSLIDILSINKLFYKLNQNNNFWYYKCGDKATRGLNYRKIFYSGCIGYNLYKFDNIKRQISRLSDDLFMKLGGFFSENSSYIIRSDKTVIYYNGVGIIDKHFKTKYINKCVMKNNSKIYNMKMNGHHTLLDIQPESKIYVNSNKIVILITNNQLIVHVDEIRISRNLDGDVIRCVCYNKKIVCGLTDNTFIQWNFFNKKKPECRRSSIEIGLPVDIIPMTRYLFVVSNTDGQLWTLESNLQNTSARLIYSPLTDSQKIIKILPTDNSSKLLLQIQNLSLVYYNIYTNITGPCYLPIVFDLSINCVNGDILFLA